MHILKTYDPISRHAFRRTTVRKINLYVVLSFMLVVVLALSGWSQSSKTIPRQGNPPRNLTELPDGHWTANQALGKSDGAEIYTVKRGDTLWDIARQYLKNPRLWPQIWEINPHILNPHWIYPNDKLLIRQVKVLPAPPVPTEPPGAAAPAPGPASQQSPTPPEGAAPAPIPNPQAGELPPSPSAETPPLKPTSIVSFTNVNCAGYFAGNLLSSNLTIMGGEEGEIHTLFHEHNIVYLNKGKNGGIKPGDEFFIVRPISKFGDNGKQFRIAESHSKYGYYYKDLGRLRAILVNDHSSTAEIVFSCEEIMGGDQLIPYEPRPIPTVSPRGSFDRFTPPNGKLKGQIFFSKEFRSLLGTGNIVYIDAGQKKNVKVGDLFRIYRQFTKGNVSKFNQAEFNRNRREFSEVRKIIGELVILRVEPSTSTALIVSSKEEIQPQDEIEQE
jgi:hypothetical protein